VILAADHRNTSTRYDVPRPRRSSRSPVGRARLGYDAGAAIRRTAPAARSRIPAAVATQAPFCGCFVDDDGVVRDLLCVHSWKVRIVVASGYPVGKRSRPEPVQTKMQRLKRRVIGGRPP